MPGDPEMFKFAALNAPDGVRIELSGELDLLQVNVVDSALSYLRPPAATLTLDLAGIEFCDSVGLQILIRVRAAALSAGWKFQIINVPANVRRILDLTGLIEYLNVLDHDRPSNG